MRNLYPIALEQQFSRFFGGMVKEIMAGFRFELLAWLRETDLSVGQAVTDSSHGVRTDGHREALFFIAELRNKYGDQIDKEKLAGKVRKQLKLIDAWSASKTEEVLQTNLARLATPQPQSVTGRPPPTGASGELWMQTVNLRRGVNDEFLDAAVTKNVGLIKQLMSASLDDLCAAAKAGFLAGDGHSAMAKRLRDTAGAAENKAAFWARDQAGKFFGAVTKERQVNAGLPGYVWRTMEDARVRDRHQHQNGKYFEWKSPPTAGAHGEQLHPGEDYNCRCWAEPAFGPEYADAPARAKAPAAAPKATGSTSGAPAWVKRELPEWSLGGKIGKRVVLDIPEGAYRQSVMEGLEALQEVLGLTKFMETLDESIVVSMMPKHFPSYRRAVGLFSPKSRVVILSDRAPYPAMTFSHEFFHWLDFHALGTLPEREAILDAIKRTDTYKVLAKNAATVKSEEKEQAEYYIKDNELLARAFEQYLAGKSRNGRLADQMAKKVKNNKGYFAPKEVKMLSKLFRKLFERKELR